MNDERTSVGRSIGVGLFALCLAALGVRAVVDGVLVLVWVVPRLTHGAGTMAAGLAPWVVGGALMFGGSAALFVAAVRRRRVTRRAVAVTLVGTIVASAPSVFWAYFLAAAAIGGTSVGFYLRENVALFVPLLIAAALAVWLVLGRQGFRRSSPVGWPGRVTWAALTLAPVLVTWFVTARLDRLPDGEVEHRGHTAAEWARLCYEPARELEAWTALEAMRGDGAIGFAAIVAYEYGVGGRFASNWVANGHRIDHIATWAEELRLGDGLLQPALHALGELGSGAEPAVPPLAALLPVRICGVAGDVRRQNMIVDTLKRLGATARAALPSLLDALEASDVLRGRIVDACVDIAEDAPESIRREVVRRLRPFAGASPRGIPGCEGEASRALMVLAPDAEDRAVGARGLAAMATDSARPNGERFTAAGWLAQHPEHARPALRQVREALEPQLSLLSAPPPLGLWPSMTSISSLPDFLWGAFEAQNTLSPELERLLLAALQHANPHARLRAVLASWRCGLESDAIVKQVTALLDDKDAGEYAAWVLFGNDATDDATVQRCLAVMVDRIELEEGFVSVTVFARLPDGVVDGAGVRLRALAADSGHPGHVNAVAVLDAFPPLAKEPPEDE